ncbi:TauD/TfdA family dioxygenase [Hassallia byssoidea VB512170]|uniref:TauD/TfdA family dioxygenase n=2 Tax=Hassallia TaxID=482629 RepID=A0A846HFM3_9CYAN|nr:TauD/TfdA family dioxygenase [Hassalia byssoidea VB512170]
MNSKIESLGMSTGKVIYSCDDCENIHRLKVATTMDLFKSSGVLLFRGFGVTHEQMKTFAERFSSRFIQDYGRPQVDSDKFVHFVDAGMDNSSFHREHGYSPFCPDVIWFCCAVPAAQGGETTFCDGVRVWEELSEETKQLFISKKLKFCYEVQADILRRFTGLDGTITDIKQVLDSLEGVNYQIKENESISIEYICSAVVKTKYGHDDAFANSILTLDYGEATLEDDSIVPDEIIGEIEKVTDKLMEKIPWQAGDLVMIDNSRFMHGRKEFNDNRRQIFSTLSNLNF